MSGCRHFVLGNRLGCGGIGVRLPTQCAVHEVALDVAPGVRVAYVDYDPLDVVHGQALLAVSDLSLMVPADARRPAELLAHPPSCKRTWTWPSRWRLPS
jgi:hypothetical protein